MENFHWGGDQVYARDVPPDFDEMRKREDRKERIKPFWDLLVEDKEPKVNKDTLLRLMHDLKEEGNALFKETHYDIAWMHYRNAIFVVKILENRFYHTVEKEFLSSLFSNRAFCCLKKNMHKEAVQDSESAIGVYPKNIKAYYRQALAYKHLKKYSDAYRAACKGQEIQPGSALKELIEELEPLIKSPGSRRTAEVSTTKGTYLPSTTTPHPDDDWLAGTNVKVTQKHLETKQKMPSTKKNKKRNRNGNGLSSAVKIAQDSPRDDDDDDDEYGDSDGDHSSIGVEDDAEFASMLKGVQDNSMSHNTLLNGKPTVLNIYTPKVEEESSWAFPHDSDEEEEQFTDTIKASLQVGMDRSVGSGGMGLDTFASPEKYQSDYTSSETTSYSNSNTSSGRSSRASQSPAKSVTSKQTVVQPAPTAEVEIIPPIAFPMIDDFDFKLACKQCFAKIGEGVKGYRYVATQHNCSKDTLIVKKKAGVGMLWVKIRCRPDMKTGHYGQFKICAQFSSGRPCKVGEEKCTFPHHQAELKMWSMDREGKFNVAEFISKCRSYNIDDNSCLESLKTKPQYIPGLNYASKGNRKPMLEQPVQPVVTQNAPAKMAAGNPLNRTVKAPIMKPVMPQSVPQNRFAPPRSPLLGPPPAISVQQMMGQMTSPQMAAPQMAAPQMAAAPYGYSQNRYSVPVNFTQPPPPIPTQQQQQQHQQQQHQQRWIRETPAVLQEAEQPLATVSAKIDNPLSQTHLSMAVCQHCFRPTKEPWVYDYRPPASHKCEETMLGMRLTDGSGPWVRVRERKNHRVFPGNYLLCRSITYKNPIFCKYGEDKCSYAHNDVERKLWTMEKDGQFNVTEFIIQHRKSTSKGFSMQEILDKHKGYFEFICRSCYYGKPPKISREGTSSAVCAGSQPHPWKDFKILAHIAPNGNVTLINPRGFLHKTAFFRICKWLQYCHKRVNAECPFAHSEIERDVWMFERDRGIKRPEIVNESKRFQNMLTAGPQASAGNQLVAVSKSSTSVVEGKSAQAADRSEAYRPTDDMCPFVIMEICQTCWKNGQKTHQEPSKDRCQKGHTNWNHNVVYIISPSNRELRALPRKIPAGFNFIVCKFIREGRKCGFPGPGPCQFAHSTEELEAWKYMCANNMTSQDQLAETSRAAQKKRAESAKAKISGQSVVAVCPGAVGLSSVVRPSLPMNTYHSFYCHYCGISCNSSKQWDEHCASEKHNFNVNSDKEHQWNYRQPPWTTGRSYELCVKHLDGNKCQYSNMPEMYNLCRYAHSQEELDEWKERYEWRQMKREMARQEKVFSYMDQLLEKYENSQSSVKVISEVMEGVQVKTEGDLNIYRDDKNTSYSWTFELRTKKQLMRVALLHNRDRLHFSLRAGTDRNCQIAQGEMFVTDVNDSNVCYHIQVTFTGGMFGSFQQWVLFDFGEEPVLCRKVSVEVGDQSSHEKVRNLRQQLQFDRWTSQNREILRHDYNDTMEEMLLAKYKEPSSSESVVTQTTVTTDLNRHNYVPKMHKLLELEEMTRHQIISSYNLCTTIECTSAIQESVYVYAKPGELFAKVPLQENLTEDTDAGKLILTSVRKVLLAPQTESDKVVYEASIVREENFNYDGRGREFIYLCLSPPCVKQLGLKAGRSLTVEIQFQMDRLFFARMHYAVDQLNNSSVVFPDIPKINPLRNERHELKISSNVLNPDQMAAVRHIVARRTGYTPPFVMFGPFGTGKTETIAQAAMVLLKETKDTRILICAQSNSAADLYILKHFEPYLKKTRQTNLLRRVYFRERRVYTVDADVKKYCLLSGDGDSFVMPSREDIEKHRIVIVTVTTSLLLTSMGLAGLFTHVFIDEAAQTMECETLMPLSLSTERTCVVLAGDHQQISPKVYSEEARKQHFHMSLLERLYNYYDSHSSLISEASPLNILLSINYRTKMEILRFISAIFYGGPDVLKSEANIRSVLSITPLVFYAVQGREVQDNSSVSYYNMSEVQEIVERVDDLYDKWPEEWGPPAAKEIGVVSPYFDQVLFIRKALKKRNPALRDVVVERVQGVQGKEFRAMFITTVRTCHLIEASHVQSGALTECDGDGGDFGFLSDSKLLNTALTRAQSLVVVVGDPVALCAIGECVNVWRTYLKHCQNMSSLYPKNHNYDNIRQQVQNLLNSPAREKLLQIANEKQAMALRTQETSSSTPVAPPTQPYSAVVQPGKQSRSDVQTPPAQPAVTPPAQPAFTPPTQTAFSPPAQATFTPPTQPTFTPPMQTVFTPAAQTAFTPTQPAFTPPTQTAFNGHVQQMMPSELEPVPPVAPAQAVKIPPTPLNPIGMGPKRPPAPLSRLQPRKVENYFELGEDFSFSPDDVIQQLSKDGNGGGGVLGGNMGNSHVQIIEEKGYAVLYSNGGRPFERRERMVHYDERQSQALLQDANKYVRCIVRRDSNGFFADVIDERSKISRLDICNRWMCGHGNVGDEVVVEVINDGSMMCGRVVGVINQAQNLSTGYIVCRMGDTSGIMVPIDDNLSPMYNLITPSKLGINQQGAVSVYKFSKSMQITFSEAKQISPADNHDALFAVRFLKWYQDVDLPLCVVVGAVPAGVDVASSMRILDLNNHVVRNHQPAVSTEMEFTYPENYQLTAEMCNGRHMDLRENWCFTIDSPENEASCRAFSIDEKGDGSYQVGVHITDIAAYIPKGSSMDIEASSRGTSLYPVTGEPVYMLPDRLSTNLCSMKPNEDRLAISVLMTVQRTGEVGQVNVQKTIVNSKKRFTYIEAEHVLHDPSAHEDYLKSCVYVLFEFSRIWRKDRLGTAALYHDDVIETHTPFIHQLVDELLIMTEYHIAQVLSSQYKFTAPLYVQATPNEQCLNGWRMQHAADAINSIALTQPFLQLGDTCKCCLACTHTVNFVCQRSIRKRDNMEVLAVLWDTLNEAVAIGDHTYIQNLIVSTENHPQLAVAALKLKALQAEPQLVCSSKLPAEKRIHYSINRNPYTHFTAPLRRYADIIVQRMLLACLDSLPCPYSQKEIESLCHELTAAAKKAKKFEDEVYLLHLCSALQSRPLVTQPVVHAIDSNAAHLGFPTIPGVNEQDLNVEFANLGVDGIVDLGDGSFMLKWHTRIYDSAFIQTQKPIGSSRGELNPNRFIYKIPAFQWQRLLIAVREQDDELRWQKLRQAVEIVRKQASNPALEGVYIDEVTSEVFSGKRQHFTEFMLKVSTNQVLQLQLSAHIDKGLLSPVVQLLNVTPLLDLCVQHRAESGSCFTANIDDDVVSDIEQMNEKRPYLDIPAYQKLWASISELEAAEKAAIKNDSIVIHNVQMVWQTDARRRVHYGQFSLPISFLKERHIKVLSDVQMKHLFSPGNVAYRTAYFADFVCIRYKNVILPDDPSLPDAVARLVNTGAPFTWVGHGVVVDVGVVGDMVAFKLELLQSDVPLVESAIQRLPCTVEILQRTEADRSIMYGLSGMQSSSCLVNDIMLGRPPSIQLNFSDVDQLMKVCRDVIHVPNQQQENALVGALQLPLTVIQGAVASGKSVLAVKLALMFAQRNNTPGEKRQVLLCAPTETDLDILTGYLIAYKVRIVRVYGTAIEQSVHPQPRDVPHPPPTGGERVNRQYSATSLYELIRSQGNRYSKALTEFDTLFSLYPDEITDDQYEEYLAKVRDAEAVELMNADIILCTCVTSGQPSIAATNIRQIVIDDCNACSEPEIVVPLATHSNSVQQVTLIGDIHQLRPTVVSSRARRLGLDKPLMSMYMTSAITLNVQYRMHEDIMAFPNKYNYRSSVHTGSTVQRQPSVLNWPAGRAKPSAFCHMEGVESSSVVHMGVVYSKEDRITNVQQADIAVKIATAFVTRYQASSLGIICGTRGQAALVEGQLNNSLRGHGNTVHCLSMLEAQGREFEYVIFVTVRTMPVARIEVRPDVAWKQNHLGDLCDAGLVSVALTRGRKGLIIIGNQVLLRCDELWNKLLTDYDREKKIEHCERFLQTMCI